MEKIELQGLDLAMFVKVKNLRARLVHISKKGTITLCEDLVKALQLEPGHQVRFDHEKGRPAAWYFIIPPPPLTVSDKASLELKPSAGKNAALSVYNKPLGEYIMEKSGCSRFLLAESPVSEEMPGVYFLIPQSN